MTPIAVIGIDCRFPGAPDKDAFWRLMMDRAVTDSEVPPQRWDVDTYYQPGGAPGTMNTRRGHFIDAVDAFDNTSSAHRSRRPRSTPTATPVAIIVARDQKMPGSTRAPWQERPPGFSSG